MDPDSNKPAVECFSIGAFTTESLKYLETISGGCPVSLYKNPFVFLSSPLEHGVVTNNYVTELPSPEEVGVFEDFLQDGLLEPVRFRFRTARCVYNVNTSQTEFAVVSYAPDGGGEDRTMLPYFVWVLDPWRSQPSRTWLTSIQNTLRLDNKALEVVGFTVPVNSDYGRFFNKEVYSAALSNA